MNWEPVTLKTEENYPNLLYNGHHSPSNFDSETSSAEELCRSYTIPLASDSPTSSNWKCFTPTPTPSLASSADETITAKRVLSRKETSFLNTDAKPVIRNKDVDVDLRAISVSSTHYFTSNEHDSNSDSVDCNYYSISGIVRSVGPHGTQFEVGDNVFGICRECDLVSDYAVTQSYNLCLLPKNVPFKDGAIIGLDYLTAWFILYDHLSIPPGSRVLVKNAEVNIGLAACQLGQIVNNDCTQNPLHIVAQPTNTSTSCLEFIQNTIGIKDVLIPSNNIPSTTTTSTPDLSPANIITHPNSKDCSYLSLQQEPHKSHNSSYYNANYGQNRAPQSLTLPAKFTTTTTVTITPDSAFYSGDCSHSNNSTSSTITLQESQKGYIASRFKSNNTPAHFIQSSSDGKSIGENNQSSTANGKQDSAAQVKGNGKGQINNSNENGIKSESATHKDITRPNTLQYQTSNNIYYYDAKTNPNGAGAVYSPEISIRPPNSVGSCSTNGTAANYNYSYNNSSSSLLNTGKKTIGYFQFQIDNSSYNAHSGSSKSSGQKESQIDLNCMDKEGKIILTKAANGPLKISNSTLLCTRNIQISGASIAQICPQSRAKILRSVANYFAEGLLKAHVMKTYPIELLSVKDGVRNLKLKKLSFGNAVILYNTSSELL